MSLWEHACRAGTTTAYHTGARISDDTGWYSNNSDSKTHEAGKKTANAWGLYDMHGNVWEWVWDWYGEYTGTATDPKGPCTGSYRILCGGSWIFGARYVRSATRGGSKPYYGGYWLNSFGSCARPPEPCGKEQKIQSR
ncbi:MAG: formylglycine-generating enzyme family protein [Spirochaetota bacterium]|nr:formylglycine-generating enzyme family protein [Spirochaetota bacterium]